jgi:hypothetical protein
MTNKIPRIAAFPQDKLLYRLVWIGTLDLNPQVLSHPIIRVWLTPIKKNLYGRKDFANPHIYDRSGSISVEVGIGMLPYLKIGTIWMNGKRVHSPEYEMRTFENVCASRELTPAMYASAFFTEEGEDGAHHRHFYIPFREYGFFNDGLRARMMVINCNQVDEDDPVRLIVPCVEAARFYYFNSTPMTVALLGGESLTDHERGLFSPDPLLTFHDTETWAGYVRLRQRMYDSDAVVIGRIALSDYARSRAAAIYESIVMNYNNDGHFTLDAYPPFTEAATWKVHGQTIRSGRQRFFLVFSIETCSGPLPFQKLYYTRDNDGRNDGEHDPERPTAWNVPNKPRAHKPVVGERERSVRFDDEPSKADPVTEVTLEMNRFTALTEKPEKLEKDECHYRAAVARRQKTLDEKDYGMGEGTVRESELTPLHLTTQEEQRRNETRQSDLLEHTLENFREVLAQLAGIDDLTVTPVRVSDNGEYPEDEDCSYMPIVSAWSHMNRRRDERRQVMIAEVLFNDRYFYLFEIGKRPRRGQSEETFAALILHDAGGAPLGIEMVVLVLRLCAENEGVWPNEDQLDLGRKRMFHKSKTVGAFAERFYDYFVGSVAVQATTCSVAEPVLDAEPSRGETDNSTSEDESRAA